MTCYIRHVAGVPVEIRVLAKAPTRLCGGRARDREGLALASDRSLPVGTLVELRIAAPRAPFVAGACVAWCRREGPGFVLGLDFCEEGDAFKLRMIEQICCIEDYRSDILSIEGRELSTTDAAREWIERYAARFPPMDPGGES